MSNEQKHRRTVRKTLTIDGDLADRIEQALAGMPAGTKEKDLINDLLRKGFSAVEDLSSRPPFKVKAYPTVLKEIHAGEK